MSTREGAIARALTFFDEGKFRDRLAGLVAIPSTSQDPGHEADVKRYLEAGIRPWIERLGFTVAVHPNPQPGFGPILTAERIEDPSRPTVLTYGHGDTVRGLEDQWDEGLKPWTLTEAGDRWYGRGTADNKGQHALNLTALEQVLAERGGKLGFNVKLVLETSEERGSLGLRAFVAANAEALKADVLIASDGPRVAADTPTVSTGTRGTFHFDLVLDVRPGGVHSGNWGGMTTDPAIVLSHAIGAICDRNGKILVRDWLPRNGMPAAVRAALAGCELHSEASATIDPGWGEPGFTAAEKVFGWNSFIVLAMVSGRPENPVNAVAPNARAHCQIRYTVDSDPTTFEAALRRHLDANGFPEVKIERAGIRMPASRTNPDDPWVRWTVDSMERSLGRRVQVIPNSGGGLPGDVFVDHLHVPLVWIPHSYNGCKQHGPNEHFLIAPARQGMAAYAGIWWDLGEAGTPAVGPR
ncbi:M20 family metallopeptidase [Limobrevibacterium gyesilva]|uniref:M20 family metallopeptidase n=1 Tax=Limobrevibacterium gyesilva TaxID=2991712 RepID=A0AA41YKI7_9PROT|nr:M20 family metallopeptidase [Limobrevibacterium gyesilva]MCW3474999.1 M20 family metallopeptidase [Limobrevibacterium gyesilva]